MHGRVGIEHNDRAAQTLLRGRAGAVAAERDTPCLTDVFVIDQRLFLVDLLLDLLAAARAVLNAVAADWDARAGEALAHLHVVHQAEFDRVHIELLRKAVHQNFAAERELRVAVAAERAARHMVCENAQADERVVRHVVLQFTRGGGHDRRRVRGVGAGVQAERRIKELQLAVFVRADAKINVGGVTHDGVEVLLARIEQLHGALDLARDERRGVLGVQLLARAEACADKRLDDVHVHFLEAEELGQNAALLEHRLRAAVDRHVLAVAEVADAAGQLDHRVLHRRRDEVVFENDVGLFLAHSDVALRHLAPLDDVRVGKVRLHRGRVVRERGLDVKDRRKVLIFDLHRLGGGAGRLLRLRGDDGHAVADGQRLGRQHLFIRHQKRRGRVARAVEVGLRGLLRQGAAEVSGNLFRLAHIDAQNLGVGIRAAHQRGVGHVGEL